MTIRSLIFTGSVLLAISQLFSRILGVWRDHLFATTFGTTGTGIMSLDAYYAAFRIPDLIYTLIITGSISVAFLPIFSELLEKKHRDEAWKFVNSLLNGFFLLFSFLSIGVLLFAEPIMHAIAPGFDAATTKTAVELMRIMMLSPLFFTLASIAIGVESAFQRFTMQALGPILYNFGIIGGVLFFGKEFGVYGATWGVAVGAFLYAVVQFPGLRKTGWRWTPTLHLHMEEVRRMFKTMVPRLINLSAIQINIFVDTLLASSLAAGSVSILNLAINLNSLPYGIIGIAIWTTSFASFSRLAAKNDEAGLKKELQNSFQQILFLILPTTIGLWMLSSDIIWFLFGGGNFTAANAAEVKHVLGYFLIGLPAWAIAGILTRAMFALQYTWRPTIGGLVAIICNILLSFFLAPKIGLIGLAIAFSVNNWLYFSHPLITLIPRLGNFFDFRFLGKLLFATGVMAGVLAGLQPFLSHLPILARLGIPASLGFFLFFAITKTLGMPEHRLLTHFLRKGESIPEE